MFRLTGDSQYLDLAELVLYNGALSGVSASGDRFFYQNPLASDGKVARSAYFDVACCPANLARTLAALPGLMYASEGSTMYVTLYGSSEARLTIGGTPIRLTQRTRYPWDGDIELRVEPDKTTTATLAVHIPGWAQGRLVNSDLYRMVDSNLPTPTAMVNGQAVRMTLDRGFARITREWRSGDVVHIYFPMPVQRLVAHPKVADTRPRRLATRAADLRARERGQRPGPRAPADSRSTPTSEPWSATICWAASRSSLVTAPTWAAAVNLGHSLRFLTSRGPIAVPLRCASGFASRASFQFSDDADVSGAADFRQRRVAR